MPDVSSDAAPLKAFVFLEQLPENRLVPLEDRKETFKRLTACLIRPLETGDWAEKSLNLLEDLTRRVPAYVLRFDKSGGVVDLLKEFNRR